jgi:hypothetical protein
MFTLNLSTELPVTTHVFGSGVVHTHFPYSKYVDPSFAACSVAFEKHAKRDFTTGVLLSFRDF